MQAFKNEKAGKILTNLIATIKKNCEYLSKIDGEIGDGDHGINMNKGFTLCGQRLQGRNFSMTEGFRTLSQVLISEIGGSMGPLYGMFFDGLAGASEGKAEIDASVFSRMLSDAVTGVHEIGGGNIGDKTLLDTLLPALNAYQEAQAEGLDFSDSLDRMQQSARDGWQATKDMVAKIGRASRLGERSRGVLDTGATSSYLLLESMVGTIKKLLSE